GHVEGEGPGRAGRAQAAARRDRAVPRTGTGDRDRPTASSHLNGQANRHNRCEAHSELLLSARNKGEPSSCLLPAALEPIPHARVALQLQSMIGKDWNCQDPTLMTFL